MRPPECSICGERFAPTSKSLVTFHKGERDEAWHQRAKSEGVVGHPPNVAWFCKNHQARATELCHLTLKEAKAAWDTSPAS